MDFKKNEKINLSIVDMTIDGLGLAKHEGQVFFVKNAIIGDKVTAIITKINNKNSNVIYAKVDKIIEESPHRVKAVCDTSDACGGCMLMSLDYSEQLKLKENMVKNNILRIAGIKKEEIDEKYEGIIGMDAPFHFRNKMQVPFAMKDGKVICGFYAARTHYIVENEMCPIGFDGSYEIISMIKKYLNDNLDSESAITIYDENSGIGLFREVMLRMGNDGREISVTFIVNDKNVEKNIKKYDRLKNVLLEKFEKIKLITLNINTKKDNVLFGTKNILLYTDKKNIKNIYYIEDILMNKKFHISPSSFYQINNVQTEKLYATAIDFIKSYTLENNLHINNAVDLYSGIGTITLMLSDIVKKIVGIEIVLDAVENAKENAKINNIKNAGFICANADADISDFIIEKNIDLISVDPPRKGLDIKTIEFIKKKMPNIILYISCNSSTLARDIKELSTDYEISKIKCVDMFPHTMHVETVALLVRYKNK